MTGNDMTDRTINFIMKNTSYTVYKSLNLEICSWFEFLNTYQHLPRQTLQPNCAASFFSSKPFRPLPPPTRLNKKLHIRTETGKTQLAEQSNLGVFQNRQKPRVESTTCNPACSNTSRTLPVATWWSGPNHASMSTCCPTIKKTAPPFPLQAMCCNESLDPARKRFAHLRASWATSQQSI